MSKEATLSDEPALVSPLLLMAVKDPVAANTLREAAQADDIAVLEAGSVNEALATARSVQPSLIILERGLSDVDALERVHGMGERTPQTMSPYSL